jgi:hypothetical protein
MAKKLVKNYVFNPGLGLDGNARPDAYSLITQNKVFLQAEINAYIQNQIDAGDPDYVGYTFDVDKCTRDSGYVIDALLFDLRYGGNEETRRVSSRYWNQDVPQIDGNRIPEYEAYQFLRDTINTNILPQVLDETPEQGVATQVLDGTKTAEDSTTTRVTALLDDLVLVIQNGLGDLPTQVIGLGRIELLGKVNLEELLIISNVTDNTVIYNFAEPAKGATVTFTQGNSLSYPRAEQVNEGTTVINFKFGTSAMSASDNIQVFLEQNELKVRPYDFGTDALERMRVGLPQAMIDADFEYGLQPTKWQAIATQRGYPSTYEVSATDIPVVSVTTDASTGSSGVGPSLITVTTDGPHGLEAGGVITIRALASSIIGFNRAEGTFIISTVPSTTTFTYYSKSKVGTASGQVLATSTTQLRKADFYTGASIGTPSFSVYSNGSSGSFDTVLQVPTGSTTIAYEGTEPPNGAPLTGTGIDAGTQITGVNGPGGSINLFYVKTSVSSGASAVELTDVTGLTSNMVIADDHGDSTTPEQVVVTSIVGTTLNLASAINTSYQGDEEDYSGQVVNSSNYIIGTGTGATFYVIVNSGSYDLVEIWDSGSGYQKGDTLQILGSAVGGSDGTNDIYVNVTQTTTDLGDDSTIVGAITEFTIIGTPTGSGTSSFTNVASSEVANPNATNGQITITRSAGSYSATITAPGTGFEQYNRFLLTGDNFDGSAGPNDATVIVDNAAGGEIQNASIEGTAVFGDTIDVFSSVTLSQATSAPINTIGTTITYSSIATIQVEFSSNHGLVPGATIMVSVDSDDGVNNHALAGGPFFITEIPALNQIRYIVRNPGTVDDSSATILGTVYPRPDSFFSHRPFDGGVQLGTGGPQHGAQAIRQSKKYIRYQSGKGAMYNTGALFAPSYDIRSATAVGTATGSLITIVCDDDDHGLQAGSRIRITGIKTVGYNGDYTVNSIVDERTFKVAATTALGNTTATIGSQCQMAVLNWHGSIVRSGPFDDQNGIFFQYDGETLSVGRRTSTFQCAGTVAISTDENAITGTNTRFLDQLQEGDRIVIRGMTHVVANIASNTSMTVTPDFRGVNNISGVKIAKVEDTIIPQNEWNLDKCDGAGPSGYNIDITKMQMIGIQFSWYGAGFIDWMFRGANGDYVFCHRLKGNNLNTEAYMRTGNLPVRYEVINESARNRLNGAINNSVVTIPLEDATDFPTSGTVYVDNEIITYSGKSGNSLTGATRGATASNFAAGSTRNYTAGSAASHNDQQGVVLISTTTTPQISHWGSAYMIDGLFDEDRGYIFSYTATGVPVNGIKNTSFLIRLAPSVSNAVVGDLGERELLNRAQLLLKAISITANEQAIVDQGGIVIEGVLNPQNYPVDPNKVAWGGLQGLSAGGQPSFAQIAPGGSVDWGATTSTSTVTTAAFPTGSVTIRNINYWGGNRSIRNGSSFVFLRTADIDTYVADGFQTGDTISGTGFQAGTTVTSITRFWTTSGGNQIGYIFLSQAANSDVTGDVSRTVSSTYLTSSTSLIYFQKASWESGGVTVGDTVNDSLFPANTTVSTASLRSYFSTEYYRVTFSQTSTAATITPATTTVDFEVGTAGYALPGETVFSFIAQPGTESSLDLSELKELTTTAIGGRGAFPNGPDVLAINVFKVGGAAVDANIILRWGEAQA